MKLTFPNPAAFTDAVTHAASGLPGKAPDPAILAGMRIATRLSTAGRVVTVSAFDYDIAAEAEIGPDMAETGEPGDVLVPGGLLAAMCRRLPDRQLTIDDSGGSVRFECGPARFTLLPYADTSVYPELPEVPAPAGYADGTELAALIRQVAVAADKGNIDPRWDCVQLEADGERLTAYATDTYRFAVGWTGWTPAQGAAVAGPALVWAPRLTAYARTIPAGSRVGFSVAANSEGQPVLAAFSTEGRTMTARLMAGNPLPSPKRFLDAPAQGTAAMDAADVTRALSRATLADPAKVRLGFCPEYLEIDAADGGIETGDAVCAPYDGDRPVSLMINPAFLSDAVTAVGDERVAISVCGPLVIRVTAHREEGITYSHVIQALKVPPAAA